MENHAHDERQSKNFEILSNVRFLLSDVAGLLDQYTPSDHGLTESEHIELRLLIFQAIDKIGDAWRG